MLKAEFTANKAYCL